MKVYGLHEISNAVSVIALGDLEGLTVTQIQNGLNNYKNAARRFAEYKYADNIVVDDYAHHPREITATINTARRKYANKEVVAIFQPHTFTRTETFLKEFAESLKEADKVFLYDIFGSARESKGNVTIDDLKNEVGASAQVIEGQKGIEQLQKLSNSVLLFMGAGDINKYQQKFLEEVTEKAL